jgi:tetratricopeptide (TPR) repeat protein
MEIPDKKLKQLVSEAEELHKRGANVKALENYSKALDILVDAAKAAAEKSEPAMLQAVMGSGMMSQEYLKKFNDYLKKDQTAAIISNNMAMLFSQMGDKASAKAFFEQAIDFTPKGVCYDDPHVGLEVLKKL